MNKYLEKIALNRYEKHLSFSLDLLQGRAGKVQSSLSLARDLRIGNHITPGLSMGEDLPENLPLTN